MLSPAAAKYAKRKHKPERTFVCAPCPDGHKIISRLQFDLMTMWKMWRHAHTTTTNKQTNKKPTNILHKHFENGCVMMAWYSFARN